MIAMLAVGAFLLICFAVWEWRYAKAPMLTKSLLNNRTFLLAVTIDFFYFMAGNMRSLYWSSYVYVVSQWSLANWTRYTNAETVALSVFGLVAGAILRATHRYKGLQLTGLCIRIIGMGVVVYTASRTQVPTVAFAFIPVLIGAGGACSVVGTRVASQASVPHHDLGQVIAQLALWTRVGGAIGTAIASTTWQSNMKKNMAAQGVPAADITSIYTSVKTARTKYQWGSSDHQAVIRGMSGPGGVANDQLTTRRSAPCSSRDSQSPSSRSSVRCSCPTSISASPTTRSSAQMSPVARSSATRPSRTPSSRRSCKRTRRFWVRPPCGTRSRITSGRGSMHDICPLTFALRSGE